MKNLYKILLAASSMVVFSACQKEMTASFSPSTPRNYTTAKAATVTIEKEENLESKNSPNTKEEVVSPQKEAQSDPIMESLPSEVSIPSETATPVVKEKLTKKDIFKEVKHLKKEMKNTKSNSDERNTPVFLVILLVLLIALLIPGVFYWVLVALVVWLVLYLLGLI